MNWIRSTRGRVAVFGALVLCLVGSVALYGVMRVPAEQVSAAGLETAGEPADIFFLQEGTSGYRLASASLGALEMRRVAEAPCGRAYFTGGRGFCVGGSRLGGRIFTFGSDLKPQANRYEVSLPWAPTYPSRVRLSPDGRLAASTVFVTGHSYTGGTGSFSTRTLIIDLDTLAPVADLEEFTVERDGKPFSAVDFNFWGVTFAGEDRFYATLGTGGHYYLIEGDVGARRARVLRDGVECPSISPDGTRLVFKSRVAEGRWQLRILDLATLADRPVGETRSVDDQIEWLDNGTLLYSLPADRGAGHATDLWRLDIAGGMTTLFLSNAFSPAVVRR